MIAVVRTGVIAGVALCAALFAAPSFAAEMPAMPTVPPMVMLPAAPSAGAAAPIAPAAVFTPTAPQAVPAAPANDQTIAQPAAKPLAPTVSLHDLVISYIDRGDQDAEEQCLAQAVFFEARGESLEGQLAVAQVVLNRAASGTFPSSICQVVTQPAQFSFVHRGHIPEADRSSECWHKALAIADIARKKALAGEVASNVLWYHATYVSPSWGRQKTRFAQIGSHIFYS